jgi:hypothetical protein
MTPNFLATKSSFNPLQFLLDLPRRSKWWILNMGEQTTPIRFQKVLLSNRQFAALRLFTDERSAFAMRADSALMVDQRSFGSLFHRGYIRFDSRRGGFVLTELGRRARRTFEETEVFRKDGPAVEFSFYIRAIKALGRIA